MPSIVGVSHPLILYHIDGDHQLWPGEPDLLDLLQQRIDVVQSEGLQPR